MLQTSSKPTAQTVGTEDVTYEHQSKTLNHTHHDRTSGSIQSYSHSGMEVVGLNRVSWKAAYIAVNEQNEPVGVFYPEERTKPFPNKTERERALQELKTMDRLKQVRLPPTQEEVRKAYRA